MLRVAALQTIRTHTTNTIATHCTTAIDILHTYKWTRARTRTCTYALMLRPSARCPPRALNICAFLVHTRTHTHTLAHTHTRARRTGRCDIALCVCKRGTLTLWHAVTIAPCCVSDVVFGAGSIAFHSAKHPGDQMCADRSRSCIDPHFDRILLCVCSSHIHYIYYVCETLHFALDLVAANFTPHAFCMCKHTHIQAQMSHGNAPEREREQIAHQIAHTSQRTAKRRNSSPLRISLRQPT